MTARPIFEFAGTVLLNCTMNDYAARFPSTFPFDWTLSGIGIL